MTLEELNSQSLTPVVALPEFGCVAVRENSQIFTCLIVDGDIVLGSDGEPEWCYLDDEPGLAEAAEKALGIDLQAREKASQDRATFLKALDEIT